MRREDDVEPLIASARAGSRQAREDLFRRYDEYLRLVARLSVGRRIRAKVDLSDLVQETLLTAHEEFDDFRGRGEAEFTAWLRRVMARKMSGQVRRYRTRRRDVARERSLEADVERSSAALRGFLASSGTSPSGRAARRELGVVLTDALEALEPDHREVIVLRSLQERDWGEIAAQMGRSPDAVRMLWARAVTRLRPLVERAR